jgi:mercuric ion binding protein
MKQLIIIVTILLTGIIKGFSLTDTLLVKTSAQCETCKKTIEEYMSFEKGIKKTELDLDTKILMVIYNPDKTNPDKIKTAITKSGYDADSLPADPKAYKRLPDCCKKPSDQSPEKH